jgi:hypothetical protein
MTDETSKIEQKLNAWVESGDAYTCIRAAALLAKQCEEQLREKRNIDRDTLDKPMTI